MEANENLQELLRQLARAKRIFAVTHIQPDGDCIGSLLGFAWGMRRLGKTVTVALDDRVPATFDYLEGTAELAPKPIGEVDVIVFLDGSDRTRFGRFYDLARATGKPLLQIDHHVTNDNFADVNYVDTSAGSCAEIVYDVLGKMGVKTDEKIARCLLTGILTDTLVFRTVGTTPETLEAAIELMRAGAEIPFIVDRVFNQRPLGSLHLLGQVLSRAKMEGLIIWSQVTQRDVKTLGLNGNATMGAINQLLSVGEARIAVLLTEREDGRIEVGLRAKNGYDVSQAAYALGGGGHKQAAGAMISGPLEQARLQVMEEVRKTLMKRDDSRQALHST